MHFPSLFPGRLFRRTPPAAARRQCRPVLECLEDRCLLAAGFTQVNLASDVPGAARVTDANLVNPWGLTFSPTGPFWFSDNRTGVSDLLDGRGQPLPLVVTIPSANGSIGSPTGTVFNGGSGFVISEHGVLAPGRFLFASQDGTISAWTALVDATHADLVVNNSSSGASYTGFALNTPLDRPGFLYAADFSHGTIDVFDQNFHPVTTPGAFKDANLPVGYVPFNIQNISGLLYVTYAKQDAAKTGDVPGLGNGVIDVYDTSGNLVQRFASGGALDSPWGMALAPANFGPFGGALLVGNNGDGHINAYDPRSGAFLGQLVDDKGAVLTIPELWGLTFGNGHLGGDSSTLFFTAGLGSDAHGLFGAIQSPQRKGADTAGPGAFDPNAPGESGDYPLPPSGGPEFRVSSANRPFSVSDLLPANDSSLTLVPTFTHSQPGTRSESPSQAIPLMGVLLIIPAEGNFHPARDARNDLALSQLLPSNTGTSASAQASSGQSPGSSLDAIGSRDSTSADRDAGAAAVLSEPSIARLEARSREEQGFEALPPSDQVEGRLVGDSSVSRPPAAEERAADQERGESHERGRRANLIHLIFVASVPMILTYWLRLETKSRR